jgi:hypothetical protein
MTRDNWPEEHEWILLFDTLPAYLDEGVPFFYNESVYQFTTGCERVRVSFCPASRNFSLETLDPSGEESLHLLRPAV